MTPFGEPAFGSCSSYFLSVKATFIPIPIKAIPQILFMYVNTFLLFLKREKSEDAKDANIKPQIVPVMIKLIPSVINISLGLVTSF